MLALEMTFWPINFFGIEIFRFKNQPWGFFGWQGIIPTKAEKMATITIELMMKKLLNLKEVFDRLEPEKFGMVMGDALLLLMDKIVSDVATKYMPRVWETLPPEAKDEFVLLADRECPAFITAFMKDMKEHIVDVLDIKEMAVSACIRNKPLVNKIFLECGDKEFTFIRRSGFYFGFLFGLAQMGIWFFYDASWTLPVSGFIVGWLTNWLALKLIFRPLKPIKLGPFVLQGIFLKRQKEVSETFARVNCVEILHTKAMWDAILTGPLSKNFYAMLRAHTIVFTEKLIGSLKPIAIAAMGSTTFAMMKEDIATMVTEQLPSIIDHSYEYTAQALDLENTIREKMVALTSVEFEGVLHPAFEEDEFLLIMVGGILGLLVGVLQIFVVFPKTGNPGVNVTNATTQF